MLDYDELEQMKPEYLRAAIVELIDEIQKDKDEIDPEILETLESWFAIGEILDNTSFLIEAQGLISFLDDWDCEDAFGTEGWRHRYGYE